MWNMFKVNNKDARTTPERRHWRRSGVFIVNFKHVSHLVLVFLLLTLSRSMLTGYGWTLVKKQVIEFTREH